MLKDSFMFFFFCFLFFFKTLCGKGCFVEVIGVVVRFVEVVLEDSHVFILFIVFPVFLDQHGWYSNYENVP